MKDEMRPAPPVPADLDVQDTPMPASLIRAAVAQFYGDPPPEARVQEAIELLLRAAVSVGEMN